MKLSIITPSFRNSEWLKLCIPSVADQEGVDKEHIVQDSCSDDGTQDWLSRDKRVQAFIEKDTGMYDAVNRGLRRSRGDILAYLNCDEQYLPGALAAVAQAFAARPEVDILLADTIVTDAQGQFICCRKSLVPWSLFAWLPLPALTSSIFFRRRVLEDFRLYFDTRWRDLADMLWMQQAMQFKLKIAVLRRYTSIFTETGQNMNLRANGFAEKQLADRMAPWWARWFHWPLLQVHRFRSAAHGRYWEKPLTYSLYVRNQPERRTEFFVAKPTGVWWQRHHPPQVMSPLQPG